MGLLCPLLLPICLQLRWCVVLTMHCTVSLWLIKLLDPVNTKSLDLFNAFVLWYLKLRDTYVKNFIVEELGVVELVALPFIVPWILNLLSIFWQCPWSLNFLRECVLILRKGSVQSSHLVTGIFAFLSFRDVHVYVYCFWLRPHRY